MEIKCEYFICNKCQKRFDWKQQGSFVTNYDVNKNWCDICEAVVDAGKLIEITIDDAISMILRDVLVKEANT